MILTIDIGNTNTELGLFEGEELRDYFRIQTDSRRTPDEIALMFRGLLPEDADITGIAMCSTVPAALRETRAMLDKYYSDVPTVIVEPGVKTGVGIQTDNPKEVGTDRVMNTLAAYSLFGGPAIVVDFGTSTNFDVISDKGEFIGGALAPGVAISVDALAQRAAQLRKVELVKPRSVIGKNTVESLQSGTLYGVVGQIDGIVGRIVEELGGEVKAVIATGGLSHIVKDENTLITDFVPELTLIGLRLVFEKNGQ
ncbi:MAG: type III pantothenate kinase [Candidatus Nanopelagicales bacterium]